MCCALHNIMGHKESWLYRLYRYCGLGLVVRRVLKKERGGGAVGFKDLLVGVGGGYGVSCWLRYFFLGEVRLYWSMGGGEYVLRWG